MLSIVQDLGRFGFGALGVSASGAADPVSLRIGNRLVGNEDGAPGVEMTLRGGTFRADGPAVVALCGSDFGAKIPLWTAIPLAAGDVLATGATRSGARCTLCVRGGIRVPEVLGSASTHLPSGIGGVEGRALRKGDRLDVGPDPGAPARRLRASVAVLEDVVFRRVLRVTPGPQAEWFTPDSVAALHAAAYEVSEASDRMGLRLRGVALARARGGELLTEGVCLGAVQVPDDGQPIVLFVDQQTTGGYPKVANVIGADLAAIGQLRPRQSVRFAPVALEDARRLSASQEERLAAALEEA
jgi:biotin-dependent carboxylase-like uncharacterized protein